MNHMVVVRECHHSPCRELPMQKRLQHVKQLIKDEKRSIKNLEEKKGREKGAT
jgi:hypothetical protein